MSITGGSTILDIKYIFILHNLLVKQKNVHGDFFLHILWKRDFPAFLQEGVHTDTL